MTRIICAPEGASVPASEPGDLQIVLYGHAAEGNKGEIGAGVRHAIQQRRLGPVLRAWDLLSIALSVISADTGVRRDNSPDGWTRQLDLCVAVNDPDFWTTQRDLLNQQLRFLTTDMWNISFVEGGFQPAAAEPIVKPDQDCVVLLSGGLDSLVGAIDLVKACGKNPYAVSQISQGDKEKQKFFASIIGNGLTHLRLNHRAKCPGPNERSQRARSIIFLAYGVLVASALKRYSEGERIKLYVCENGFISVNPPLTISRLGSLSTRTTHPIFIGLFQKLLDNAGLLVTVENPYQFKTKGEMLKDCVDQSLLYEYAHMSTSCGRYARNAYTHCGRCLPCLIRRAAFHAWGVKDRTKYVYTNLSLDDEDHARYDDVRSAAIAVATVKEEGLPKWIGTTLNTVLLGDISPYEDVVRRGLDELADFLKAVGVT